MTDLRLPILLTYLALGAASASDVRRFRIPNALTLAMLASGLAYHAAREGRAGLGMGLAGAAFGFLALIVPYAAGGLGAGDVKLLAGVGAWLGFALTRDVLLASIFAAGLYAFVVLVATGRLGDVERIFSGVRPDVREIAARPDRARRLVPFAAMVAAGLVATVARG